MALERHIALRTSWSDRLTLCFFSQISSNEPLQEIQDNEIEVSITAF